MNWLRLHLSGAQRLMQVLAARGAAQSLMELHLSHNALGDEGVEALCKGLDQYKNLHFLELDDNDITSAGASKLADALTRNVEVQTLELSRNNLGDDGIQELFRGLQKNTNLHSLVISYNGTTVESFRLISLQLAKNQVPLSSLTLSEGPTLLSSYKGDQLAAFIGVSLSKNTTLSALNLPDNMISDVGAGDIASSLIYNRTLKHLNLRLNKIGAVGASKFGEVLPHNTTMQSLDLTSNEITSGADTMKLVRGLEANVRLTDLSLLNNYSIQAIQQEVDNFLERNRGLQALQNKKERTEMADTGRDIIDRQKRRAHAEEKAAHAMHTYNVTSHETKEKYRVLRGDSLRRQTSSETMIPELPESWKWKDFQPLYTRLCPKARTRVFIHSNDPRRLGKGKRIVLPPLVDEGLWDWILRESNRVLNLPGWPARTIYLDCAMTIIYKDNVRDILQPGTEVTIEILEHLEDGTELVISDGRGDGITNVAHYFRRGENQVKKKRRGIGSSAYYWRIFSRFYRVKKALVEVSLGAGSSLSRNPPNPVARMNSAATRWAASSEFFGVGSEYELIQNSSEGTSRLGPSESVPRSAATDARQDMGLHVQSSTNSFEIISEDGSVET